MKKKLIAGIVAAMAISGAAANMGAAAADKDIVDTAVAAGSFKTLVKALQAADLVATLKGAGPFTVFAPTDEAFAKLPAGTLEALLKPENKREAAGHPHLPCRCRESDGCRRGQDQLGEGGQRGHADDRIR